MPTLAPQQLISCDPNDNGCNGGLPYYAFQYIQNTGGLDLDSKYPETSNESGQTGSCQNDLVTSTNFGATVTGNGLANSPCMQGPCDGQDLSSALSALDTAPFSIAVNANPWQTYTGGVMTDANCPHAAADLDHAVVVTGLSLEGNYIWVRNSWSDQWGINGWIKLQANANTCGWANLTMTVSC